MNLSIFSPAFVQFIPLVVFLLSLGGMVLLLEYKTWKAKKGARRNPLTADLLRPPGYSLSQEIDEITKDLIGYIGILGSMPLMVYAMALSRLALGDTISMVNWVFYVGLGAVTITYTLIKISKAITRRTRLRLGLDAELFIGQELNHLMRDGYYVYHDFPAEKFNIDHVVISPAGVFAIETKGRSKPSKGNGSQNNREVIYDGNYLQFPGWREDKPLKQAALQAEWLKEWLTKAVGEPISVKPILAIPGWFINRKKNGIPLINGKNCAAFFLSSKASLMDETLVKRIAFSIEQRCRDVKPLAYQSVK